MKIAVAVPAGLVAGLVLGTLGGKMLNPPEAPPTEASADSAGAAETPAAAASAPVDSGTVPSTPEAATTPPMTPPPIDAPAASTAAPGAAEVQRLGKILDRLAAPDAIALVERWSDPELEAVLRVMEVAKAADLVAALPKARAATMSKRLLAPAGTP